MFESVCLTKVIIIFQDLPIIKMYIPMKRYSLKFIFLRKNRCCADRWDAAGE